MNKLLKALSIASIAHKDQKRKGDGGAPYINHLIEVASLLSEYAQIDDDGVLEAAILHDILEDTTIQKETLLKEFGERVLSYIQSVTDDKTLSLSERRKAQLEHISAAPVEVKLIKLADHCSNVASIPPAWDKARIIEYLEWSHQVASKCFEANENLAKIYMDRYEACIMSLENA